jgi:pullulanase
MMVFLGLYHKHPFYLYPSSHTSHVEEQPPKVDNGVFHYNIPYSFVRYRFSEHFSLHQHKDDAHNKYYYRYRQDGTYSDASGCGNETASEREQMRNYIINSVKYWAEEYHIDGFRFDLMAIHDTETMNKVAKTLKEVNPRIFVYGEGWTCGDSPLPVERRALKENVAKMEGIAVFSDDLRDAVKGHYSNGENKGFATNAPGNKETVKIGIVASTAHPQVDYSKGNNSKFAYATAPTQIIN